MQHLEPERLAAFDHDPFTDEELAHLAACAPCRAEREAHQQLVTLAGVARHETTVANARLAPWETLSAALRTEGLITSPPGVITGETAAAVRPVLPMRVATSAPTDARVADARGARPSLPSFMQLPKAWRVAATMALMVGSAYLGRASVSAPATSDLTNDVMAVQPVSLNGEANFASIDAATAVLSRAQRDYERASLWLAANDSSTQDSEVFRARLAALDQMMAASRAALRDAPQDPVLNHYFLAAYAAREATLQQLGGALPVDKTIERY